MADQKQAGEKRLTSLEALLAALEDPVTAAFIRDCFSSPEERPKICFRKSLLGKSPGPCWRVVVIECPSGARRRAVRLFNIALVDVDAGDGTVLRRRFFRNLLAGEIRLAFSLDIHPAGCKGRNP